MRAKGDVTDDIDRTAKFLVDRHGDDAPIRAAMRADELMNAGDMDGRAVWLRVKGGGAAVTADGGGRGALTSP